MLQLPSIKIIIIHTHVYLSPENSENKAKLVHSKNGPLSK